jgi:hypothetical protein
MYENETFIGSLPPSNIFASDFDRVASFRVVMVDNKDEIIAIFNTGAEWQLYRTGGVYPTVTEEKKNAINPSHYKSLYEIKNSNGEITDTIQWLEHLQYKPFWRNNMQAFVHAVRDMCGDKYLSRMGAKDDETQEMQKALWYYKFATAVMLNGYQPIRVVDIERILSEKKSG